MFKLIGFAIRYAPIIISAVTLVEGLVSKDTSGPDKKALVIKTVREVLERMGVKLSADVENLIGNIIDVAVTLLNLFGIFKRKEDVTEVEEATSVPAETVKVAAQAVKASGTDTRLEELESILRNR